MHKNILVPTDFSDNAFYAAKFACNLAIEKNLGIHLYHFYTSASAGFNDETESDEDDKGQLLQADLTMVEIKKQLNNLFPSVEINSTCSRGLLQEKLPKIADQDGYELIVMGTTGDSEKKSIVYGSNTSAISSKSPIPVIAIPNGHEEFNFRKIGLLTNFKTDEIETLIEYIHLIGDIEELYLIHVYKEDDVASEVNERLESWSYNIREIDGVKHVITLSDHISKDDVEMDSISEVVNLMISKNNLDLILVNKTRKSFFDRIFKPSISKEIALDIKVPTFFDKIN
ncbi:universal stress protein [Sphingobacterium hungaricum]